MTALAMTWSLTAFGALSACGSPEAPSAHAEAASEDAGGTKTTDASQAQNILDQRKTDYGEALRTASLKLRDRLPDLSEIKQIESATDQAAKKVVYETLVDAMLASPDFARMMVKFWKDTFRIGQVGAGRNNVNRDAAPNFAAQIVVEGRNYTELFTATENTCPAFDADSSTFTAANCAVPTNGMQGTSTGVLTDPGLQSQYFANMAFRRVRFVQETFVCSKFPAEFSNAPVPMGDGVYTAALPFASITGKTSNPNARVDFQDTKAVICANCHANLNHVAPLFINWDERGALRASPQVKVPIPGEPLVTRGDYLPDGEGLAWRNGKPLTDMASLGRALAEDPDVARCAVNRVWNYAMSRGDIVNDLASVPNTVTQPFVDKFSANGMKLVETIRDVFKSDDFTKF